MRTRYQYTLLLYIVLAVGWMLATDYLLVQVLDSEAIGQRHPWLHLLRGLGFILFSALLLFLLLRQFARTLRRTSQDYQQLFEANPNAMWVYARDTLDILAVNEAAARLYGYSPGEMQRFNLRDFVDAEQEQRLAAAVAQVRDQGYANSGVWPQRKRQGERFFIQVYSHDLEFQQQAARLVLAVDVTAVEEARQALTEKNQALSERERYLSSLVDLQSTFLVRIDPKGNYLFANRAFYDTYQLTPEEVVGTSFLTTVAPEDAEHCRDTGRQCLAEPGRVFPVTLRKSLPRPGHTAWTEWELTGIAGPDGEVREIQAVGRDVTEKVHYLRAVEQQGRTLDQILTSVNDVIWSFEAQQLHLRYINPAVTQVYGYPPEAFFADPELWFRQILPEDQARVRMAMRQLATTRQHRLTYRIRHRDGSIRHLYQKATYAEDPDTGAATLSGVAADVTPLKDAERLVERAAARVYETLESITDGFFAVDRQWQVTYVNQAFERMMGVKREDVLQRELWQLYPHDEIHELAQLLKDTMATRHKQQGEVYAPGVAKWLRLSVYPSQEGLSAYFQDITEEKARARQIELSQQNLSALINSTVDFILSVDRDLRILSINEPFQRLIAARSGHRPEVGDPILTDAFGEETRREWENYFNRALAGESFLVSTSGDDPQRGFYAADIRFNPIRDAQGQIVGVGCFSRNVTHQHRYQRRVEAQNAQLREIARIQSHDIRRPVASILGIVELLQDAQNDPAEQAQLLDYLQQTARELDQVILSIVDKAAEIDSLEPQNSSEETSLPRM